MAQGNQREGAPRFNYENKRNRKPLIQMEWMSKRYSDSTAQASRALLKAQLLAGQHTLDTEQFVKVAKHHGWLLQIPQRLLA